ncbi:MAG: type I methionyl aminopeptidase [Paludibacteraceae bacterium]|nr:type I methionyl aminopeptidase [Paludibacteraceae bacterium]
MIYLKTDEEVELMRESNRILGMAYGEIAKAIAPGVTTAELNRIGEDFVRSQGGVPSCLGFEGFPAAFCISVNEQLVHGIPDKETVLREGDIVTVDGCVLYKGFHSDSAYTFPVGKIDDEKKRLLQVTKECLYLGIEQAVTGHRLGDIGFAIQNHAEKAGFQVCREYVGHGIGREMHEDPEVNNYGRRGNGIVLKSGMTLAIEPMVLSGRRNIILEDDGWTARSADRKPTAHYELSVCVRNGKADVLSTFEYIEQVLGSKSL